jgi:hypothetical protein
MTRDPFSQNDAAAIAQPDDATALPLDAEEVPDATEIYADASADAGLVVHPDAMPARDADPPDLGCVALVWIEGAGCYATIGAAVSAAAPGAVIEVASGTYVEALNITIPLTLRGPSVNPPTAVLAPPAGASVGVTIAGRGVTLANFALNVTNAIGVDVSGVAEVDNVTLNGAVGIGIRVEGTATISRSLINGVTLMGSGGSLSPGVGIYAANSAVPTRLLIKTSTVQDAGYAGIMAEGGILTVQNTLVMRSGAATCQQPGQACGPGILAETNAQVSLLRTTVRDSARDGIRILTGSAMTMSGSESSHNGLDDDRGAGVYFQSPGSSVVEMSIIDDNHHSGVWCEDDTAKRNVTCNMIQHSGNGGLFSSWTNCDHC